MNEKDYENYVALGKKCLQNIQNYQIKISQYALNICDIRHGGISKGYYTIKDYARDIGMNDKTLSNWITVYRDIIQKLPKQEQKNPNWKAARKAHECLRQDQIIENKNNDTTGRVTHYKRDMPAETVTRIYTDISSGEKPFISEVQSMITQLKNKKHLLTVRDLNIASDTQLIAIMELFDECSDIVNDHLTNKKKQSA